MASLDKEMNSPYLFNEIGNPEDEVKKLETKHQELTCNLVTKRRMLMRLRKQNVHY